MSTSFTSLLGGPINSYSKSKNLLLKAVLPFLIIVHHLATSGLPHIGLADHFGSPVMYLFFAMSGYGLVTCYINKPGYLDGFLKKSLTKLYVPYLAALTLFTIYRACVGISSIDIFISDGICWLVPTSWFIFVLSLFYVFFFVVFKYVKSSDLVKVLCVCALVGAYYVLAPKFDVAPWRYGRCPAFCVGMFFALYEKEIMERVRFWMACLAFIIGLCVFPLMIRVPALNFWMAMAYYPIMTFLFLCLLPDFMVSSATKFFSNISMEMYILQYIPIYLVINDFCITNTFIAMPLVLAIDVALAFVVNKADQWLISRVGR